MMMDIETDKPLEITKFFKILQDLEQLLSHNSNGVYSSASPNYIVMK